MPYVNPNLLSKIKRQSKNSKYGPKWGRAKGKHMFEDETADPAGSTEKPADQAE